MKILRIICLCFASVCLMACAKKPTKISPGFSGVTSRAESASSSVSKASEESEAVKKLQLESMELLDRIDHKAVILLEQ